MEIQDSGQGGAADPGFWSGWGCKSRILVMVRVWIQDFGRGCGCRSMILVRVGVQIQDSAQGQIQNSGQGGGADLGF